MCNLPIKKHEKDKRNFIGCEEALPLDCLLKEMTVSARVKRDFGMLLTILQLFVFGLL
jgi:hypothetical protein